MSAEVHQCNHCGKAFVPEMNLTPAAGPQLSEILRKGIEALKKHHKPLKVVIFGPSRHSNRAGFRKRVDFARRVKKLGHDPIIPEFIIPRSFANQGFTLEMLEQAISIGEDRYFLVIGGFPGSNQELAWLKKLPLDRTLLFFPERFKKGGYVADSPVRTFRFSSKVCYYRDASDVKPGVSERDDFKSCFLASVAEWCVNFQTNLSAQNDLF